MKFNLMKLIAFFIFAFTFQIYSQNLKLLSVFDIHNNLNPSNKLFSSLNNSFDDINDSVFSNEQSSSKSYKSKKSPGLAFIYGLLIPGMGHLYVDRFNTGKYFIISEAVLWLSYAAFTIYGNWMLDDAYSYAVFHAGITLNGKNKDDKFFIDIANYNNVDEYNNEKLRFGEYDKLYLPELGYGFWWNSPEERRKYREDKISGDRILNDRLFIGGAVIINHLISAISAVFAANSYNESIKKFSSSGFNLRASVIKNFNKVDGIKINISKFF